MVISQTVDTEQRRLIADTVEREGKRLRRFIAHRVASEIDAEDILQDVFAELVEAYQLMTPIEQVGAWLFRVARNRITDLFRRKRPDELDAPRQAEDGTLLRIEDLLPSPDAGPDAVYARTVLMEELADALEELPPDQRDVFVAHEINGRSFRELSDATGVSVAALLSRKHQAVVRLRRRLQSVYADFRGR
jgi:RNA polymerase sigma factor (sigma-70 family)